MENISLSVNVKDLCRLCAKNDDSTKDLMDDINKNVLQLVLEFVHITITNSDNMSTKICPSCEEKIVSFHLFILDCNKVQDTLRKLAGDNSTPVKIENYDLFYQEPEVKTEVDNELTAEDIVSAIVNHDNFAELDGDDYDDDSMLEDVTIASLKKIKRKQLKHKTSIKTSKRVSGDLSDFPDVVKKRKLKVKDYIKIVCNICDEKFQNWQKLNFHCTRTHKTKPLLYCVCGEEITSQSHIYRHLPIHREKSKTSCKNGEGLVRIKPSSLVNFDCHICQKMYPSYLALKEHTQRVHKTMPIIQCTCGLVIKSKTALYKHVADHNNPNTFTCDKCPKVSKSQASLDKHKQKHVPKDERVFACDSCTKIFNTKEGLKSHARSHIPIEERKCYECEICYTKFTSQSSLRSHKKVVHEKIKAYVCDLCGFSCSTNGELRQHRAIHSDEKPFVCTKCSKPFKTYSNLKTHMDTHEDTSYECYLCNRILNSRRTLRKHLLVHQSECRHVCTFCNRAFKRRQTLKVHLSIHTGDKPMACKWCNERFAYASTLRSHRLRYHPEKMAAQGQHNNYANYSETHQPEEPNSKTDDNVRLLKMNPGKIIDTYVQNIKNDLGVGMPKVDAEEVITR